jgi:NAD(P)-dependent dehydrogenase (short-subunit alcohol dehydrogenase family)
MEGGQRSALVTGASTGIGRATAERLSSEGWQVFAGVRGSDEVPGAETVELDVTSDGSITAAAELISARTGGRLDAVVNNAGIPVTGAVETIPADDWRLLIDTNLTGSFLVTQAVLPMIRAAEGKVLFVTSLGGRVAFPYASAYHASKFALEGLADSLRAEVESLGVDVICVEPGSMSTEIWGKGREHLRKTIAGLSAEQRDVYGDALEAFDERLASADEQGEDPAEVAGVIHEALSSDSPEERYLVGKGAGTAVFLESVLPSSIFDRVKEKLVTAGA